MGKKKTITVLGKVERMVTDRSRYKNYAPEVSFDDLYVTFEVPASQAVQKDGQTIVDMEAFTVMLDTFASHLDEMHRAWEEKQRERHEQ